MSLFVWLKFDSSVAEVKKAMTNPTLLSLFAALLVAEIIDGLGGGVKVQLEAEFVHLQPQQVHLSVSGEAEGFCMQDSHNLLTNNLSYKRVFTESGIMDWSVIWCVFMMRSNFVLSTSADGSQTMVTWNTWNDTDSIVEYFDDDDEPHRKTKLGWWH